MAAIGTHLPITAVPQAGSRQHLGHGGRHLGNWYRLNPKGTGRGHSPARGVLRSTRPYPILAATVAASWWSGSAYTWVTSARECPSITWAAPSPYSLRTWVANEWRSWFGCQW